MKIKGLIVLALSAAVVFSAHSQAIIGNQQVLQAYNLSKADDLDMKVFQSALIENPVAVIELDAGDLSVNSRKFSQVTALKDRQVVVYNTQKLASVSDYISAFGALKTVGAADVSIEPTEFLKTGSNLRSLQKVADGLGFVDDQLRFPTPSKARG